MDVMIHLYHFFSTYNTIPRAPIRFSSTQNVTFSKDFTFLLHLLRLLPILSLHPPVNLAYFVFCEPCEWCEPSYLNSGILKIIYAFSSGSLHKVHKVHKVHNHLRIPKSNQ